MGSHLGIADIDPYAIVAILQHNKPAGLTYYGAYLVPRIKPRDEPPACALRPVIPINACTLRITAAAGTELAGES